MEPKVSILVPCFNGDKYLRACLDSVLAQTFGDIEILIVDDGSTDATVDIADEYQRKDRRAHLIRNETNLGLVGNWNRCLARARGEWIKFVFHDDLVEPTCLADLLEVGEETSCPLVFGRRDFVFEGVIEAETQEKYRRGAGEIERLFPERGYTPPDLFCQIALDHSDRNFIGEPIAVLFRRELTQRVGTFNPHLIVFCDMEYWMRIGVNTGVAHAAKKVASFRVHDSSTTSRSARNRSYRMFVLDHVVVSHEFAFHPTYSPLRRYAAARGIDLAKRFEDMTVWAHGLALHAAHDPKDPDLSLLSELESVEAAYPRVSACVKRRRQGSRFGRLIGAASEFLRRDGTR